MAKNLWPQRLIELLDVAPIHLPEILAGSALIINSTKDGFEWGTQGGAGPQGPQGEPGVAGPSNVLTIGTVEDGVTAAAIITGTSPAQALNLVLPKGNAGINGTNGTNGVDATDPNFSIAGVAEGVADVELTGIYPNLGFLFTVPKGNPGDTGPAGPPNILAIGTVTSGPVAEAVITGTSPIQTLDLTLPVGPRGLTGPVGPIAVAEILEVTATRDLASTDEAKYLRATSATAVSLTVPLDLALTNAFAEIHIRQAEAGLVTIVAAGGVTINVPFGGTLVLAGQGATVTLKKVGTNEYDLFGLVEAAP